MNETGNPYAPIMIEIEGKRYDLRLTVATMRALRKLDPAIDITKLVDPNDPNGGLYAQMSDDPGIVVDIVYHALKGQEGIPDDPEAFARMIGGDQLAELYDATLRAIVSFTPSPRNREVLTKIIERVNAVEQRMHDQAMDRLDDPEIETEIMEQINATLGPSTDESLSCKGSSGSTQEVTHFES